MQTVPPDSPLNDANFLAELASLDEGMTAGPRSPLPAVEQSEYEPLPDLPGPVRTTLPGKFAEEPATGEPDDRLSILGQVAAAMMFVLMMGVGAAGAALVFHEQVARILATW